jgi:carbonic anhydrase
VRGFSSPSERPREGADFGPYRLGPLVGEGAMAHVFRASRAGDGDVENSDAENLERILAANAGYAESVHSSALQSTPARQLVVITCMDCRINPYEVLGISAGEAHVLRNAGGIVTGDTLRSLAVSHGLLGTKEAVVIMHTDCGMGKYSESEVRRKLGIGRLRRPFRFGCFSSVEDALAESVAKIRSSPLLPPSFKVHGLIFDVSDGRLRPVD